MRVRALIGSHPCSLECKLLISPLFAPRYIDVRYGFQIPKASFFSSGSSVCPWDDELQSDEDSDALNLSPALFDKPLPSNTTPGPWLLVHRWKDRSHSSNTSIKDTPPRHEDSLVRPEYLIHRYFLLAYGPLSVCLDAKIPQ